MSDRGKRVEKGSEKKKIPVSTKIEIGTLKAPQSPILVEIGEPVSPRKSRWPAQLFRISKITRDCLGRVQELGNIEIILILLHFFEKLGRLRILTHFNPTFCNK